MSIWRLVLREMRFRSLNFFLSIFSILAAVGCLVAAVASLQVHDGRIEDLSARKTAETEKLMREFEDDTRKNMLRLGFNVLIVHKDEDRQKLAAGQAPASFMPESYVAALSGSEAARDKEFQAGVVNLNHLLPVLSEHLLCPDRNSAGRLAAQIVLLGGGLSQPAASALADSRQMMLPIILTGTRGEVPIIGKDQKKPLISVVPKGSMIVGHEVQKRLGLAKGQSIELSLAREVRYGDRVVTERLAPTKFKVHAVNPAENPQHDITIWINLDEAQELLRRPGQINGIFALECVSPDCPIDRFHDVEEEIARRLPGVQVIPRHSLAAVRAAARSKATALATANIGREIDHQKKMKEQQENFASILVPLVLLGAMVWLGVLAFSNARDRIDEIGILRTLGVRSAQILGLFLSKAAIIGLIGGLLGYAVGAAICFVWASRTPEYAGSVALLQPVLLLLVVIGAPLLGVLASLMPAFWAAQQDPAIILQQE